MEQTIEQTMEQSIEAAIKLLAGKITTASRPDTLKSDDALKYTQAALNLAHVLQVKKQTSAT